MVTRNHSTLRRKKPEQQIPAPTVETKPMKKEIWYRSYKELARTAEASRKKYIDRCIELGADFEKAQEELSREIIARSVHESNWQEGIKLTQGRTRELADAAFEKFPEISGPHLDLDGIVEAHRKDVLKMRRRSSSFEEIAAFNLAKAHVSLDWIGNEIFAKQIAAFGRVVQYLASHGKNLGKEDPILQTYSLINELKMSDDELHAPHTGEIKTKGELFSKWLDTEPSSLDSPMRVPMRVSYIHFLHRITMMGILPANKCGVFRKHPVHIEGRDLYFPPASTLDKLMDEYCVKFPSLIPNAVKNQLEMEAPSKGNRDLEKKMSQEAFFFGYEPIKNAAQASYRFVKIHPYADGNGRISRLIMNLCLWRRFHPVYLKADKKGKHRYIYSLRLADRKGDTEPLACLIALSLTEVYNHFLEALNPL